MTVAMAFLDMLGVASIMPFMAVLANSEIVETNNLLYTVFKASSILGVETREQFLFALGILVFALLVIGLTFKALCTYMVSRFALVREYSIGRRLVEGYLQQPYSFFLNRHSSDFGKSILSEVKVVIDNGLMPLMSLMAQSSVAIALMALLLFTEPILAVLVGFTLIVSYCTIFIFTNDWLKSLGSRRAKANHERFTAVSEVFGAVKEVKVGGLEQIYIQRFAVPAKIYAHSQASAHVIAQLPRFLLEIIVFGGIIILTLYLMMRSGDFSTVLPIIALYAFAGYRLMPALQQIYISVTQLRFAAPAIDALHADLLSLKLTHDERSSEALIPINHDITLNRVLYTYPNARKPALNSISLNIPLGAKVGFVGVTGSGKTTLVDLILGILVPQDGSLSIDGQEITSVSRRQWQRSIGYVPQQIYLTDDSVAANIAFGVELKDINQKTVERVAKIANLHNFIINDLPHGYSTEIGERGTRLSGGQRQLIGIARALYHNPQLLILDEATSALDNITEEAVMDAVNNLGKRITIIMVAHRLTTLRNCDEIFLLECGKVIANGTFEELASQNKIFSSMISKK